MKTPEGYVKSDVRKYLKSIGAYFFSNTTFGYGASGQPDICCCIRGRFVGLELKAPEKEPTTLQMARIKEIRRNGGFAFWSTSVDDVREKLKKEFGLTE